MKKLIIVSAVLFMLASCTKDISKLNVDTKNATNVPSQTLFSNAQKNLADAMSSSNINTNIFRLLAQHWTTTTYTDEPNYDLNTRGIPQIWWRTLYRDVLIDLTEAKRLLATEASVDAVKKNQMAMIDIMQVYTYYVLVNTYGNIPYTEASDYNKVFPKYDDAKTVYYDLLTRLDADIAALNTAAKGYEVGDLLYDDNITSWKKFGNSLKLKMGILLVDVDAAKAKSVVEAAAPNTFTSNADNAIFTYLNAPPNTNPIWVDLVQSNRQDFISANTLVDRLNALVDPRRQFYLTEVEGGGYKGGTYGASNSYINFSKPDEKIVAPDFAGDLLDYAEIEFYKAEAVERGMNVAGTAEQHYNNAIEASIKYWGGTDADVSSYLSQPQVAYATAAGDFKQKIGTQIWIALYNRGFDAWTAWRKYDYPVLIAPPNADSPVPQRFTYPVNEQNLNVTNYNAASAAIGGDKVTTKLFWDKL
ncbi:MAG: SusD/RagB family nutrient-binding outer membrane lipoprotein [Chitinophagaceae bacterium]